jgi:ElaB/YqjD/DUF883 family membrane-anchored ribosome-binding protein
MTETYAGQTVADDIVDEALDSPSAQLDRQADILLEEGRSYGAPPIHRAAREDAQAIRDWGQERAGRVREAVEAEPLKATLYALGVGVVIGMLLRR